MEYVSAQVVIWTLYNNTEVAITMQLMCDLCEFLFNEFYLYKT